MFALVALLFRPFLTERWKRDPVGWLGMVFVAMIAAFVTVYVILALVRPV